MSREQQELKQWADDQATFVVASVMRLPTANQRITAIVSILNTLQSGLANVVQQRMVVFRRFDHTYPDALRMAVSEALMRYTAKRINSVSYGEYQGPGGLGNLGDLGGAAEIMNSVASGLTALVSAGTSIASAAVESRERREAREFSQEQWRAGAAAEALEAEREVERLEQRAEEEREEREERRQAAREERTTERGVREDIAPEPSGLGGILLVAGIVGAVVIGGGVYLSKRSKE